MYSDIIPMNIQDELIRIRDRKTRDSWKIADLVQKVIEFNEANGKEIATMLVYAAVGSFVGKASRTVREIHSVGRFFPPEIREQFGILAFAHFRVAARLGDRAIEALQWCVEEGDQLNRPATIDAMEVKFLSVSDPQEPETDTEGEGTIKQIWRLSTQILNLSGNWEVEDGELQEAVDKLRESCVEVVGLCGQLLKEERE